VLRALDAAEERGLVTAALLGGDGGAAAGRCDVEWIVPSEAGGRKLASDRIQELHMLLLHAVVGAVEKELFG
jgi:phosphoheptose isomerase